MYISRLYIFIFSLLIVGGLLNYQEYNYFPADDILEILLIVTFIATNKDLKITLLYICFLTASMVLFVLVYNVGLNGVNFIDFVIAYKSVFYLSLLCFFVNKNIFNNEHVYLLFKILMWMFFAKYFYSRVFDYAPRPGIFTENNFEIMLLILLALASHVYHKNLSLLDLATLGIIVVLSGSRSGMLSFIFIYAVLSFNKLDYKTAIKLILLSIFTVATALVFYERLKEIGGSIESIDRYIFFQHFLLSIKDWNVGNYLFGNFGLTPLPSNVCANLTFFHELFSHGDSAKCYSVIFHSYILRIIYDIGFVGFISVFTLVIFYCKCVNLPNRIIISVLGLTLINGLSVSSLNSVYFAIGFIFLISGYSVDSSRDMNYHYNKTPKY